MKNIEEALMKQTESVREVFELTRKNIFSFRKESGELLIKLEKKINSEEERIELLCLEFLNHRDFSKDELTRLVDFMKFNSNIEKIADHLKKINNSLEYLSLREMVFPLINVENILKDVLNMFEDSVYIFLRKDIQKAAGIKKRDEDIDKEVWDEFLRVQEFIARFPQTVKRCQNIIRILNYLERIGDICKNTGEYISGKKHEKTLQSNIC